VGYVFIKKTQGKRFCNKEYKKTAAVFFRETNAAVFGTEAGIVSGKKRPAVLA